DQIRLVEHRVNELIRENNAREELRDATMEQARQMGAIALFGEKYGDRVRVIKFGDSVELCGGCHTSATGNIGYFQIVSESAIAAGVRRIEAVTGVDAELYSEVAQEAVRTARSFFNNIPDLNGAIQRLIEENANYKKQVETIAKQKVAEFAKALSKAAEEVDGVQLITVKHLPEDGRTPSMVRDACLILQKELSNTAIVAAYEFEGKPQLLLMYSADLVAAGKNAGKDIREAAKFIQGGGGGQPALATAGGKNSEGLAQALECLRKLAVNKA
ncbi:MAG: DHHA1 domain-containing protein, partial [Candidatus Cryptobacteroides sp.]